MQKFVRFLALPVFLLTIAAAPCRADDGSSTNFFESWFTRASKTQAEQPRWITPLSTVTPRLEQELRYDQSLEKLGNGHSLDIYGGKGIELIPAERIEVIIGIPAYEEENTLPSKNGWADETFLVKYRILSANAENGNYILSAFMGLSVPSGSDDFTSHHYAFTPTIAFGKGWGNFDFQSTLGVTVPDNGATPDGAGTPIAFNTALQYRVEKFFWPEVEANYTYWPDGEHEGLNQLFLTPGLVIGRLPICGRLGLTFAVGCQFAVMENPVVRRNIILSARIPF